MKDVIQSFGRILKQPPLKRIPEVCTRHPPIDVVQSQLFNMMNNFQALRFHKEDIQIGVINSFVDLMCTLALICVGKLLQQPNITEPTFFLQFLRLLDFKQSMDVVRLDCTQQGIQTNTGTIQLCKELYIFLN